MSSVFNSNPKPEPYTNKITLEDLQKAAEEVFGKELEFPRRKLADDYWWQLFPNCYGNDKACEDLRKFMNNIKQESTNIKLQNWRASNGILISFDVEPKKRRCKK